MSEATPLTASQVQEFIASMRVFYSTGEDTPLFTLFELFDRNGDRRISRSELKVVMESVDPGNNSDEAIEKMIQEADLNKDGVIDLQEFLVVMKKHR